MRKEFKEVSDAYGGEKVDFLADNNVTKFDAYRFDYRGAKFWISDKRFKTGGAQIVPCAYVRCIYEGNVKTVSVPFETLKDEGLLEHELKLMIWQLCERPEEDRKKEDYGFEKNQKL